jgi:hypothetical protein
MSITAASYAKARSEIAALFGWNAGALSPEQMLRLECATALRLALDDLQGGLIRGERIDMNRMLTASEALAKLLPPAVLAAPPPEHRDDPREHLWQMYKQMRERGALAGEGYDGKVARIAELEAEVAALKAGGAVITPSEADVRSQEPIDPPTSDIVPPGERAECDPGPRPGPDDRKSVTIEGKAEPADEDAVDIRQGFGHVDEPWRRFSTDIEGNPLSVGGRKYWGPV